MDALNFSDSSFAYLVNMSIFNELLIHKVNKYIQERTRYSVSNIEFNFSLFSGQPALFWVSSYMSVWSNILFNCAVLINLIVAIFYPFPGNYPSK
jgi:hypothetical protein